MISNLSKVIARFLCKKRIIDETKIEIYQYGYEIILSTIIGFMLILIIGFISKCFFESLIFYFTFVFVRSFTGGYHANSHVKCKLTLILCCILVLYLSSIYLYDYIILVLFIFYLITVIAFSPIEHINAPLTHELKIRNCKISIIMVIMTFPLIVLEIDIFPKLAAVSSWTLFIIAILIIIPKIQERREMYEENNRDAS